MRRSHGLSPAGLHGRCQQRPHSKALEARLSAKRMRLAGEESREDERMNPKYWNPIIETLPRERLLEIELKRFREALRWAKERSPFYRRKLEGIEPEDIRTLEDVARVPMTEKDELREAQEGKEPYLYGDLQEVTVKKIGRASCRERV
jgi:hypothetical protein